MIFFCRRRSGWHACLQFPDRRVVPKLMPGWPGVMDWTIHFGPWRDCCRPFSLSPLLSPCGHGGDAWSAGSHHPVLPFWLTEKKPAFIYAISLPSQGRLLFSNRKTGKHRNSGRLCLTCKQMAAFHSLPPRSRGRCGTNDRMVLRVTRP